MIKRTALITGSTGGIGKSITSSLQENVNVISPTRKELDLSSNSSIDDYISSLDVPIDIIVNCAGIHKAGNCEDLTIHDFQNILQKSKFYHRRPIGLILCKPKTLHITSCFPKYGAPGP